FHALALFFVNCFMLVLCCVGQAKAFLTIHPKSSQIFSGESVTFRCNIQRGKVTDWKYTWRKDDVDSISRKHEYEISEVNISNSGDYRCLGEHIDNGTYSQWSDAVRLTVTGKSSNLSFTSVPPYPVTEGDSVTLSCTNRNQETNLIPKVDFYKDGVLIRNETTGEMTIPVVSKSDEGFYKCKSNEGESPDSWVTVREAKAVLTIRPKSSQIFSGESVTFRCNIQRGKVTDWEYTWRKDVVDSISRKHEYEISEVNISNSGNYWCLGTHIAQKKHSKWSDAVSLTVTGRSSYLSFTSVSPYT
uniref:Ig-like domain-containing protein n=1 Tax=Salmo trutta TaxID=8032 RepID=A0A674C996_SALTR